MLSETRDTIVALSTPPGMSGIAVVRLSGPRAFEICRTCLESSGHSAPIPLPHGRARLRWLQRPDGRRLDQALVMAFHEPRSYTGEDVVEFHLHGSPWLVECLLDDLCLTAVPAEPGEFTRRAVENGRLDLSQAEGVRALTEARGELAHELALRSLSGETSRRVHGLLGELMDLLSVVEAELDFSEHEITITPRSFLLDRAEALDQQLATWRASWRIGRLSGGAQIVLAGLPNAGKSTLMNALLGSPRVLVDAEPGTTRDSVSHELPLGGLMTTLWDSAGIRDSAGRVEQLGVSRTRELLDSADLVLHLRAPGQPDLPELAAHRRRLLVHTMSDMLPQLPDSPSPGGALFISATTGQGLPELRQAMLELLLEGTWRQQEIVLCELRQVQLVDRARGALGRFRDAVLAKLDPPLAAADLREATEALGAIVGGAEFDELYPLIFTRFCIGK